MRVFEIMNTKVITASPRTSFFKIWQIIFKKGIHGLPIVDKDNKLLGIIAEEDLFEKLYPPHRFQRFYEKYLCDFMPDKIFEKMEKKLEKFSKLRAQDIMNKKVFISTADTPILRALARMMVHRVRQLPVITSKQEVIGMITKGDIFKNLFKKHLRLSKTVLSKKK